MIIYCITSDDPYEHYENGPKEYYLDFTDAIVDYEERMESGHYNLISMDKLTVSRSPMVNCRNFVLAHTIIKEWNKHEES